MIKKSLQDAFKVARKVSGEYPDTAIRVMDKKGAKATYTASSFVYSERVLKGYHTITIFKSGEEVVYGSDRKS